MDLSVHVSYSYQIQTMTSLLGKNSGSSRHALQMMQSVPEEDMKNENISYTGEEAASSSDGHDDSDSVEIASNETRLVHYSKVLVVGVIVIVAIIIGFITLTFVKQQEESTYRAHVSKALLEPTNTKENPAIMPLTSFVIPSFDSSLMSATS